MAKPIRLVSTAYGPPWGGIQGTGVTKTGIDLRKNPKQYVVAVDPSVIPLGTKLKIPKNPFGDPNIVFTAADIGGAIKGKRLDFYDWRGRKTQIDWGTRPIEAEILGQGGKPQRASSGAQGAAGGSGATFLPGKRTSGFDGAGGADIAAMISSLMKPQQLGGGGGMGLPDPTFSARKSLPLPAGYQPVQSGGGPRPQQQDVGDVLRTLLPALGGGDIPKASSPGLVIPGNGERPTREGSRVDGVRKLFERAASIDAEQLPYKWGGGHGPTPAKPGVPLDCSGAVSRLLGVNPRVSGQFETFGKPGRGKSVTIYANEGHVLMEINGRFWGTSATNPGGGAGWIPRSAISPGYLKRFTARHPAGM